MGNELSDRLTAVESDLSKLRGEVDVLKKQANANAASIARICSNTDELVTIFKSAKLGVTWFKWTAAVAASIAAVWATLKGMK